MFTRSLNRLVLPKSLSEAVTGSQAVDVTFAVRSWIVNG